MKKCERLEEMKLFSEPAGSRDTEPFPIPANSLTSVFGYVIATSTFTCPVLPRTASSTIQQHGRHRTTSNATTASTCCFGQITHHSRTSASHGRIPTASQSTSKPAARSALSTISTFSSFSRRPETLSRCHHERHSFFVPRRTKQRSEQ